MGAKNIMRRQWAKLYRFSDDGILQGPIPILIASVPSWKNFMIKKIRTVPPDVIIYICAEYLKNNTITVLGVPVYHYESRSCLQET